MNSEQGSLAGLCENGRIDEMLADYIELCAAQELEDGFDGSEGNKTKKSKRDKRSGSSFPNVAGFCRFLGVGTTELEDLAGEYPLIYGRILAVLEDEALNSGMSATLISAYLKKRLGYDLQSKGHSSEPQLQIRFEHDVIEDGG